MPKRKKPFIDSKGGEARHYRLVHRSQRDPLQADENASRMVLQALPNGLKSANRMAGARMWQGADGDGMGRVLDPESFAEEDYAEGVEPDYEASDDDGWEDDGGEAADGEGDWETDEDEEIVEEVLKVEEEPKPEPETVGAEEPVKSKNKGKGSAEVDDSKIGQAPLYGIFLDDREYDYTKHLKPIGETGEGVFIAAKGSELVKRSGGDLEFREEPRKVRFELPEEALPSRYEEDIGLLNRAAENKNLLIEVDPSVREVLYALEDDAYVDDELDDDFFGNLDKEKLAPEDLQEAVEELEKEDEVWGDVQRFKRAGGPAAAVSREAGSEDDSDEDDYSEDRDDGVSKFSMTSSALFRTKHMTLLDDRFDKMLADEYEEEDEEERDNEDFSEDGDAEPKPNGVTWTQEQMTEHILSQFLSETVLQGHTLVPSDDPMEELANMRAQLRDTLRPVDFELIADGPTHEYVSEDEEEDDRKWDVETVLTTYSNIYNHPAMLEASSRARREQLEAGKIELDAKGFPVSWVDSRREEERKKRDAKLGLGAAPAAEAEQEARDNKGVARKKGESKGEKKARKEAVKEERRTARQTKKELKAAFETEKGEMIKSAKRRDAEKGTVHIH